MAMLSTGAAINGPDVRLMLEGYLQAMEVAQEVSTFLLMCGGAGKYPSQTRPVGWMADAFAAFA